MRSPLGGHPEKRIVTHPFDCISEFVFVEHEVVPSDILLVPGGVGGHGLWAVDGRIG
jgi:hypothetical protein